MTPGSRRTAVLLVEDHADTRQMYAEFLRLDFDVLEAGDGIAALDVIQSQRPQVVVTDLSLPGMDGLELIRRIRGDERFRDIRVIALSGYSASDTAGPDSAGFDLLLQKPCLPEALAAAIETAATGRKEGQ